MVSEQGEKVKKVSLGSWLVLSSRLGSDFMQADCCSSGCPVLYDGWLLLLSI